MARQEHLDWAKERALECCDNGKPLMAWISFRSDMNKHDETCNHPAIPIGDKVFGMFLQTPETVQAIEIMNLPGALNIRKFIEGFN